MFTKQNVIDLLKTTRSSLDYLEKMEIVVPIKVSKFKHYYTWQQLRELKVICKLKENGVTTSKIKQAQEYLKVLFKEQETKLHQHKLISYNKNVQLIEKNEANELLKKLNNVSELNNYTFTTITGTKQGQIVLPVIYDIDKLCNELLQDGRKLLPDFDKRLQDDNIPILRYYKTA